MAQSRKDLVQAHRLMTQRAALALVRGEPDAPDQPLRRLNVGAFSGVLAGVTVAALFVILALLGYGGTPALKHTGTIVIDQTGAPYVFCEQGKKLCPAVNYASARLALASTSVHEQRVSQSVLGRYPRGPLIGIRGLPQPLPAPAMLIAQPWSVCAQTTFGTSGRQEEVTSVVGGILPGGRTLGGDGLLVEAQNQEFMIWKGRRIYIPPAYKDALSTVRAPVPVPAAWLDTLPSVGGFGPPRIRGLRSPTTGPTGRVVPIGQVYRVNVAASQPQYYVVLGGGRLARITELQARLLGTVPGLPGPLTLSPSQVSGHLVNDIPPAKGLPQTAPQTVGASPTTVMCVVYSGDRSSLGMSVTVGGRLPSGAVFRRGPGQVTEVALPPGRGALVGSAPGTGRAGGSVSYFLVADGHRYALTSQRVAAMLGYDIRGQAVQLPSGVVDLIPVGRVLDPAQAARPVRGG